MSEISKKQSDILQQYETALIDSLIQDCLDFQSACDNADIPPQHYQSCLTFIVAHMLASLLAQLSTFDSKTVVDLVGEMITAMRGNGAAN